MGTNYVRANQGLLDDVGLTRYLTVTTGAAQAVILGSANQVLSVYNLGSGSLLWGDSNIAVNSGSYLFVNGRIEWTNLQDAWTVYLRAESVSTLVAITEYRV